MKNRLILLWFPALMILCGFSPASPYDESIEKCRTYEFGQTQAPMVEVRNAVNDIGDDAKEKAILAERISTLLENDTTFLAKDFACRQLAFIGTAKQVPILAEMLRDEQLSDIARYALEGIPDETVDDALIDSLKETEGTIRVGIINTIAVRRSQGVVDVLLSLTESDNSQLAEISVRALGKVGGEKATTFLQKGFFKNGKGYFGHAYLDCAENYMNSGNPGQARVIYEEVLESDADTRLKHVALRSLFSLLNEEQQFSRVLSMLKQEDGMSALVAARLVRESSGDSLVKKISGELKKLPPRAQIALLKAFFDKQGNAGFSAAKKALQSQNEPVRVAALESLGILGNPEIIPLLIKYALNGCESERKAAYQSLLRLSGSDVNDAIVGNMSGADSQQVVTSIKVLTERHATAARDDILELLDSPEPEIRLESLKSLMSLGHAEQLPALLASLQKVDNKERTLLVKTLGSIVRRSQNDTEAVVLFNDAYQKADDQKEKISIVQVLGDVNHPNGLETIREALISEDRELKYAAVQALASWKSQEAMGELLNIATTSDEMTHRVIALRGYIDQLGALTDISPERKLQAYKVAMLLAEQAPEKKKVLSGISQVQTPEALKFLQNHVEVPALKEEAAIAWAEVAKIIYIRDRQAVESGLAKMGSIEISDNARNRITEVADSLKQLDEYLTDWQISEFYQKQGETCSTLFDIAFAPENETGEVNWKPMEIYDPGQPWYLDIEKTLGSGDDRVAYLRTRFESDKDIPASLEMGSDDGIKSWFNGELVYANNTVRGYTRDSDRTKVRLKKGTNELLIKVTQANAGWGASVRVRILNEKGELPDVVEAVDDLLTFEKRKISDRTFEAASVFDVNNDGEKDIISGGYWYLGPDFDIAHKICEVQQAGEYFDDFSDYPMDVNGDGYMDIVTGGYWGNTLRWRENPKGQPVEWNVHIIAETGAIETTRFWDIDGDGFVEAVPNASGRVVAYRLLRDTEGKGTGEFETHVLMPSGGGHGFGFGDVNGDNRGDFIVPNGWLEAPEKPFEQEWTFHAELNLGAPSVPILVHDVNEDGFADLIVGEAHGYGLYWMEQIKDDSRDRSWKRHDIDPNRSQYHDLALHDIDNDGEIELITGKRYRAHCGNDPGSEDCVGIYYFEMDKGRFKRGVIDYGPSEEASGAGIYFWVEDINGDGWKDIVAPGKEGLHLFLNQGR